MITLTYMVSPFITIIKNHAKCAAIPGEQHSLADIDCAIDYLFVEKEAGTTWVSTTSAGAGSPITRMSTL